MNDPKFARVTPRVQIHKRNGRTSLSSARPATQCKSRTVVGNRRRGAEDSDVLRSPNGSAIEGANPDLGRFLLAILILFLALTSSAIEGVVWTLDGRRFDGDVRLGDGVLVVARGQAGEISVPAADIARAQFSTNVIAAQTRGSGNGLLGIYYPSTNFSSNAVMRLDETVDFDWRDKEPLLGIPKDGFCVRWMAQIEAPTTDAYTIFFGGDEGGRICLDGKVVADNWGRREYVETNAVAHFKAGERHNLKLEYMDSSGNARARLSWSTPAKAKAIIPQDRLYAASFDTNHQADASGLAGAQGLLATYYDNSDFTGNSFTRIDPEINFEWKGEPPAPGMPTNNFSVRWSGNLLVTNNGDYVFYIFAGLPIRLFINEKLISNPAIVALQNFAPAHLNRGERAELRLELHATNNVVPVKLFWSGPGFPKTVIGREHLSPAIAPSREAPLGHGPLQPAGVVLLSGATVSAPIESANSSSIRLRGVLAKQPLSLTRVARIHARPLTTDLAAAIPNGRPGVFLKNNDFIDGDFVGIENGRVKIESVLFGTRTFDLTKDVIAVVLRGNEPPAWRYSITARDGTVLWGKRITMATTGVALAEAPDVRIRAEDLAEIVRRQEGAAR